jgi:hypothetical protein
VPELQRLRADHASAVLAFELANRAYFATFISDRGNEFYDHFTEQYKVTLAEQEAGTCIFHVLVSEDGTVLGRFNLYRLQDGTAELGYRVAQHVAGRGVATAARLPAAGNRDQAVPVFTVIRSAEEEPGCVPAASPQVRRRPSLWPPGSAQTHSPELPAALPHGRTHRTRPASARFEPVSRSRRNSAGSSRTPFRHARRTRPIWQY